MSQAPRSRARSALPLGSPAKRLIPRGRGTLRHVDVLTSKPIQVPSDAPTPKGSRGAPAQGAGWLPPAWSLAASAKHVGEDSGILQQRTRGPLARTRTHGAFRPSCSSFLTVYGPLEAVLPFVLPNSLQASKSARDLANICQDTSRTLRWSPRPGSGFCAQTSIAPRTRWDPLRRQLQAHQGGVCPSLKSPA